MDYTLSCKCLALARVLPTSNNNGEKQKLFVDHESTHRVYEYRRILAWSPLTIRCLDLLDVL